MPSIREDAREVAVVDEADVLVCGAGPAGAVAAIAAARAGAATTLIEAKGQLGGMWTTGLLAWVLDARNKDGILREIIDTLVEQQGPPRMGRRRRHYSPELVKIVLERMCREAGVRVRLHTPVVGACVEEDRLRAAVTESKSGREAWRAEVFVDATGDGDLAARAGCGFEMGRPEDGRTQPMSLICLIAGPPAEEISRFIGGGGTDWDTKSELREEMERAGVSPSYSRPLIMYDRDGLYGMMSTHEYGLIGTDADELTRATLEAREEINRQVAALRSLGEPWSNLRLVATAEQIGVRGTRRIHGLHRVTVEEMTDGARHEDAVCRVRFNIDVHSLDPAESKAGWQVKCGAVQPYDIPLRALIARDVDGLLMAGRCISGDFLAHSSYRVQGDAAALGEAAGVTAALAASHGHLPREVPFEAVQEEIPAVE